MALIYRRHLVKQRPPILSPLPLCAVKCSVGEESRSPRSCAAELQEGSAQRPRAAAAARHSPAKLAQKEPLAQQQRHSSIAVLLDTGRDTVVWSETKWELFWGREQVCSQSLVAEGNQDLKTTYSHNTRKQALLLLATASYHWMNRKCLCGDWPGF